MSPWEDAVRTQLANDRAEYQHWRMQVDYFNEIRKAMTTITIADVLKKIDDDLAWRGPNDNVMGHVVLKREEAEYLRKWAMQLCIERDELLFRLDANKK